MLIVGAAALSLPAARKKLDYKIWRATHFCVYFGLALSIGHQLALGGDLSEEMPYFALVWYALLLSVALNSAWNRLAKPFIKAKLL